MKKIVKHKLYWFPVKFKSSPRPSILALPMLPLSRKLRRYKIVKIGRSRRSIFLVSFLRSISSKVSTSSSEFNSGSSTWRFSVESDRSNFDIIHFPPAGRKCCFISVHLIAAPLPVHYAKWQVKVANTELHLAWQGDPCPLCRAGASKKTVAPR